MEDIVDNINSFVIGGVGVGARATGSEAEEGVDKDEMFSGLGVDAITSLGTFEDKKEYVPLPIKWRADRFCDLGETFIDI
jgi:hypothetical protein